MTTSDPRDRRPWRTDEEWTRLHSRLTTADADARVPLGRRRLARWAWPAVAAAVIVGAIGGAIGISVARRSDTASTAARATPGVHAIATKPGERRTVRLDDSSTITLAPATTLRIGGDPTRREIELVGMANFQIRHDPTRPFVVRAGDAVTTDVGTQFVVRAYPTDSSVRVAVTEGSVLVQSQRDSASAITLTAGEVAQVRGGSTRRMAASAPLYATWIDNGLSFENATLAEAATDLGRWFDAEIRVPASLGPRRVSAIYNDPTLNGVLDALAATVGFTYTREGRVITIRERGSR